VLTGVGGYACADAQSEAGRWRSHDRLAGIVPGRKRLRLPGGYTSWELLGSLARHGRWVGSLYFRRYDNINNGPIQIGTNLIAIHPGQRVYTEPFVWRMDGAVSTSAASLLTRRLSSGCISVSRDG
jgi:hypothetical protein